MDWDLKFVGPLLGALVAFFTLIFTIFWKRHEINNLEHKRISDKLTSSNQYFEKYYENDQINQLVLDRAAQDLTKCPYVTHALVNKMIDFHQNFLIDFDEMIYMFENGQYYIRQNKGKTIDIQKDLKIVPFLNLSVPVRKGLFVLGYFIFAFSGLMLFSSVLYLQLKAVEFSLVLSIVFILIAFLLIYISYFYLVLEDRLRQAARFIERIYESDEKYKKIEKPKRIILLGGNKKPS